MSKNKVITSINTIEKSAVDFYDEKNAQKKMFLNIQENKQKVLDYIFGRIDENPMDYINKEYTKKIENLNERIEKIAKIEKNNYLGKSKKSTNFVKKLADTISKETQDL